MLFSYRFLFVVCAAILMIPVSAAAGAQQNATDPAVGVAGEVSSSLAGLPDASGLPEAPQPQTPAGQTEKEPNTTERAADKSVPKSKEQPKRILGIMPNYRAVSAGAIPPPPTARESFKIATENSFDYSSYVFVGLTSMIAEGQDAHPALGKGVPGFWGYTWRGFVDKADGNYWVIFVLPSVFHEDERFYAKGEGRKLNRAAYAASRILITPNYHGHNTFNTAELLGRGIGQGISLSYYPGSDQTLDDFMEKYGYAVMRDAATNVFREFWPDIATHVMHRHRNSGSNQ